MKYVYYISLVLFTLFRKVFGLVWYWFVVWFRGYGRNTVYNYVLQNGIKLKRLEERNPKPFIKYRKISKLEYIFALFFIWGWVDDDSGADTFSKGHNQTYINKERYIPDYFRQKLIMANLKASNSNYFDMGDNIVPCFDLLSVIIWNGRNTAYNFSYMFEQISDERLVFYKEIFGLKFGWQEDGMVNGIKYYKMIFGYNF